MRKLTQEEFIKKCTEVHGGKYDYSLVEYKNTRSKVEIICKDHGTFSQLSKGHKNGQGCPKCVGRDQPISEFINLSSLAHNNRFDYSLVSSILKRKYIRIIDKESNIIYRQIADHHQNGMIPTKMERNSLIGRLSEIHHNRYEYHTNKKILGSTDRIEIVDKITGDKTKYRIDRHLLGMCPNKVTLNYFKIKSSEVHNNKYDYSLVSSISGNKNLVEIICPDHGIFTQRVTNHMNLRDGCPKCSKFDRWDVNSLLSEFNRVHFSKYDYSLVEFKTVAQKIKIVCKDHGVFQQNVNKHLLGQGCPSCSNISIGEEYVKFYLEENKIKYIKQHGFDSCKYINKLNFDFYLPDLNTCIEFDGIQHFKPVRQFGGQKSFVDTQKRDECKNKWCDENKVKLIRIGYVDKSRISEILDSEITYGDIKNNKLSYPFI